MALLTQRSLGVDTDVAVFALGRQHMAVLSVKGQRLLIYGDTFAYSTPTDL